MNIEETWAKPIHTRDIKKAFAAERRRGRVRLRLEGTYGKLYVHGLSKKGSKQPRRYLCDCLCGRDIYLTAAEIRVRQDLDQGCAHENCEFTQTGVVKWLNLEYSLRKQWASIIYHNPYQIQHSWGGDVAFNKPTLEEPAAFENFYRFVKPKTDVVAGKIWVHKSADFPFYGEDSIYVTSNPSGCLHKSYRYLFTGAKYEKCKVLAERIGVPVSEILLEAADSQYSYDAYLKLTT